MKVNELTNLWVGYNKTEDFRVLIRATDTEEAQKIADDYCNDSHMGGIFEIAKFDNINIRLDCDYVLDKGIAKIYSIGDRVKTKIHYQNDSRTEVEAVIRGIELEDKTDNVRYKIGFEPDEFHKKQGSTGCCSGYVDQDDILGLCQ